MNVCRVETNAEDIHELRKANRLIGFLLKI